ncbi:hypothetical protein [Flavobacterium alkalisoli]|uniref:hypothetical protein n=1 Tax=Flavobacterium alkalisoli TaxID=2602769 RepID=UPI003A926EA5
MKALPILILLMFMFCFSCRKTELKGGRNFVVGEEIPQIKTDTILDKKTLKSIDSFNKAIEKPLDSSFKVKIRSKA